MIWGEFITQIRNLHLEFLDSFALSAEIFTQPIELTLESFPFPATDESFGEWNPPPLPEKIRDAVEQHPVERALLEGPLMPIQTILMEPDSWETLYHAIYLLEKEWLVKSSLSTPNAWVFLEENLRAKFLQLQRRSGRFGLKAL